MTIRIAFSALVFALSFAAAAQAAPIWNGAAWYQVADTLEGWFMVKGPFGSKADCQVGLPANEGDADYLCQYLTERPSWDD